MYLPFITILIFQLPDQHTVYDKDRLTARIRQQETLSFQHCYLAYFPDVDEHRNHFTSEVHVYEICSYVSVSKEYIILYSLQTSSHE